VPAHRDYPIRAIEAVEFQPQQQRTADLMLVAVVGARLVEFEQESHGAPGDRNPEHAGEDDHGAEDLDAQSRPLDGGTDVPDQVFARDRIRSDHQ
jgi:hypothetical protein